MQELRTMKYSIEASRCGQIWTTLTTDTELSRYVTDADRLLFNRRCEAEGLTFLSETLPLLGKSLDAAFQSGVLTPVVGFKRVKGRPYPLLLRKAWEVLFNEDGSLRWYDSSPNGLWSYDRDNNYADAANCIRQLTLMFYKLKLPYSEESVERVYRNFRETENDLQSLNLETEYLFDTKSVNGPVNRSGVLTRARMLICRLLHRFDPKDITPKHGSGASACRVKPWLRYSNPRFIPKLDAVFPYSDFFYSGGNSLVDNLDGLQNLPVEVKPMARIILVPKDSRGPRLISAEPREFMYIQQGLMATLYKAIESYPAVRSMVSCIDQSRNQRLASYGSQLGHLSTIDLKDASDRVSLQLVRKLFPENWVEALEACRSERTHVPGKFHMDLVKFAPMGSAVCFPIEAIVFWAITLAATVADNGFIHRLFDDSLRTDEIDNFTVFGDDIICPTEHVQRVMESLESVGLLVNRTKCFTRGPFRESCGNDSFLGTNIAPVRMKNIPLAEGEETDVSYAQFRTCDVMNNLIVKYGASLLTEPFRALFTEWYGPIPTTTRWVALEKDHSKPFNGLALIGLSRDIPDRYRVRMNSDLHRSEVYIPTERSVRRKVENDDWSHVLRSLLNQGGLEGTGIVTLAKRYRYKYGWVSL